MFPGMDMGGLQKQALEMKKKMEQVERDLRERVVEATVGGGVVVARANGAQEIVDVKIDPKVLSEDKGYVEDMVIAAVNEALKKARKMKETEMAKHLQLPPGFGGMF